MDLLERDSALAALAEYAADARTGRGRLVLVGGEAGAGKTALVERAWSEHPDALRLWGACDGLFTPRPLGPLFDIAEQLGGDLARLCQQAAEREALFTALLRALREAPGLAVVIIDDAHWADEATIDLLRFLGRRIRDTPALLVVTYRDDELAATDPLRLAIGDLASQTSTRRIDLPALSEQAVRTLARGSGIDPARLHRLTGGNPFFVTEVVRAGAAEVPASARDAVLARVGRLGAPAREALQALALMGRRTDPALFEAATGAAASTVDELVGSGLVTSEGGSLAWRHEIARRAVETTVGAHRRHTVHKGILAALVARGSADDAALAFHAEGAGDTTATLAHATRAARHAAELGAHREAVAQFARALRCAGGADEAEVAALHTGHAGQLALLDRWQEAADEYERALALWRRMGDARREGDVLRQHSRAMWRLCRGEQARAATAESVRVLTPLGATPELAWALANLAARRMEEGHHDAAIEAAEQAQELARALELSGVLSEALNTEACARADSGQSWIETMTGALRIARADGHAGSAGRAYANLHCLLVAERRFAEADGVLAEGVAYCLDHDMPTYVKCLRGQDAMLLHATGRWDAAAELCAELLREPASPVNRLNPLLTLGLIRARRGEEEPWAPLDQALAAAEGSGDAAWLVPARLARAEAHWLAGDRARARAELALAAPHAGQATVWLRGELGGWARRLESVGTAAAAQDAPVAAPYRLLLDGLPDKAARALLDLGCRYDAALALLDTGEEEPLREALAILDGLGAAATARIIRQRMRQLGIRAIPVGARAATRAHPMGLTDREQEILDHLCHDRSNAEIATALHLSTRTVDHHVSAVLTKLGTPTRRAAAARARELGLVGG